MNPPPPYSPPEIDPEIVPGPVNGPNTTSDVNEDAGNPASVPNDVAAATENPIVTAPASGETLSEINTDMEDSLILEVLSNIPLLRYGGLSLLPTAECIISKTMLALQQFPSHLPMVMAEMSCWKKLSSDQQNFVQESVSMESQYGERLHTAVTKFFSGVERYGLFPVDSKRLTDKADFDQEAILSANCIDMHFGNLCGPLFLLQRLSEYLIHQSLSDSNAEWLNRVCGLMLQLCRIHTTNLHLKRCSTMSDVLKCYQVGIEKLKLVELATGENLKDSEKVEASMALTVEDGIPFAMARLTIKLNCFAAEEPPSDPSSSGQPTRSSEDQSDPEPDSIGERVSKRSRENIRSDVEALKKRVAVLERKLNQKSKIANRNNSRRSRSRSRSPVRRNFMKKSNVSNRRTK